MNSVKLEDLNLVQHPLDSGQYIAEEFPKRQIYLHHTVGNPSGQRTIDIWNNDRARIGTAICISRDGTIVQAFSSKYWAFHLGLKESVFQKENLPYLSLDKTSIGIELCAYGPMTPNKNHFKTIYGHSLPETEVVTLDKEFRGSKYWHKYTDEQIESLRKLLLYWGKRYSIPLDYDKRVWDVWDKALRNKRGVYSHVSVRYDKSDIYPDPRLIEMWKGLTK